MMRKLAALCGAVVAALFTVLATPSPASAHAVLERTDPASGAVVAQAPEAVTLSFSEDVTLVPGKVTVSGPDGKRATAGDPTVRGRDVRIPLRGAAQGTYLVNYRVISADSHPVFGSFTFSVGAPSAAPPDAGTPAASPDANRTVAAAMSVAHWFGYVGLVLTVGPAVLLGVLWPRRLSRRGPTRLVTAGLTLVGLGALAELYLQAPYSTGTGLFGAGGAALRDVLDSRYGTTHVVRLALVLVAALLLRPYLAGRGSRADQVLLVLVGAGAALTWPLSGHPVASNAPLLTVSADAVHLAAMSFWLGGLVMLLGYLLRRASDGELAAILPVWSRWALAAVVVLVLAGLTQTLVEMGSPRTLIDTTWGRLLLLKIGLLAVIVAAADVSRRLVPRAQNRRGLTRSVAAELAVAVVLLGATSVLVQTTPARGTGALEQQQVPGSAAQATTFTLPTSVATLQVDVDPGQAGDNLLHLYALTPDGKPQKVEEWHVTAALPAAGIEPMDVTVEKLTDDHAIGQINLPRAGQWEFSFTVRTSEIDQATVTRTVRIN